MNVDGKKPTEPKIKLHSGTNPWEAAWYNNWPNPVESVVDKNTSEIVFEILDCNETYNKWMKSIQREERVTGFPVKFGSFSKQWRSYFEKSNHRYEYDDYDFYDSEGEQYYEVEGIEGTNLREIQSDCEMVLESVHQDSKHIYARQLLFDLAKSVDNPPDKHRHYKQEQLNPNDLSHNCRVQLANLAQFLCDQYLTSSKNSILCPE